MVKLIVGVKGTGKTKTLIEMVNSAVEKSSGSVVCIEKGAKLKFDIKYQARLIDTSEYDIANTDALYGLVCGLYAENYDITHIFIDSALKICGGSAETFKNYVEPFEKLIQSLNAVSDKHHFECIITSSIDPVDLPESLNKYL